MIDSLLFFHEQRRVQQRVTMSKLNLVVTVLACLHAVQAFNCPEDSHAFYHADVSTGCQVYHRCENSQLQTFTCPSGQAFNHGTSNCEDASTVSCYETMGDHSHHHHHKRSLEEYHTIDIQEFKTKIVKAYRSIKPVIKEAIKDLAPTVYAKFEESYLPKLNAVKEQVMPFFKEKVYPQVQKGLRYSMKMIGKVIDKLYRSYKLSNSTHVTIVSMSDIAEQVGNDLKPLLDLGKFLTKTMSDNNEEFRSKREVAGQDPELPETMERSVTAILDLLAKALDRSMRISFLGKANDFFTQVAVPLFYEMISNEGTRNDAMPILASAKSAFDPIAWEILKHQSYDTLRGTTIKIPRGMYVASLEKFVAEANPVVMRLLEKYVRRFFSLAAQNIPAVEETFDFLRVMKCPRVGELRIAVLDFLKKHGSLLKSSSDAQLKFYPLSEILEDLKPVKEELVKLLLDRFDDDNLWLKSVFGPVSSQKNDNVKPLPKLGGKKFAV